MVNPRLDWRILNKRWRVGAKHGGYIEQGNWYNLLKDFPGALFDANGYLLFMTESEFRNCEHLDIGKTVNVRRRGIISSIPGYVRVSPETTQASDLSEPTQATRVPYEVYRRLRDSALTRKIKSLHRYECQICGEAIQLQNEQLYAESHHIRPLGSPHDGPDVPENILCVCPNHHAQLDYGAIRLNRQSLRTIPEHQVGDEYLDYHNTEIFNRAGGAA